VLAQALKLLKMLLQSKMPLTDVFLPKSDAINIDGEHEVVETAQIKLEGDDESTQAKTASVKLLHDKNTNKIGCAEAGEEFVDGFLSFLTSPLGSIVKFLQENSSIGCVDNL